MMTCLTETSESYADEIVVELKSDGSGGEAEVEDNVRRIAEWVEAWRIDQAEGRHEADE
jgi:adenylate kinase